MPSREQTEETPEICEACVGKERHRRGLRYVHHWYVFAHYGAKVFKRHLAGQYGPGYDVEQRLKIMREMNEIVEAGGVRDMWDAYEGARRRLGLERTPPQVGIDRSQPKESEG